VDSIKTWTGLPVEESIRMTEDRNKWRKYVDGVATGVNPAGDAGDTSPPIFWLERTSTGISPNIITYFGI